MECGLGQDRTEEGSDALVPAESTTSAQAEGFSFPLSNLPGESFAGTKAFAPGAQRAAAPSVTRASEHREEKIMVLDQIAVVRSSVGTRQILFGRFGFFGLVFGTGKLHGTLAFSKNDADVTIQKNSGGATSPRRAWLNLFA